MTDDDDPDERQREQAVRHTEREQFWRAVMHSDIGRREMHDLLINFHAFTVVFGISPVGFADPLKAYYEAGRQSAGQDLLVGTLLKYARTETVLMLEEHDHRLQQQPPSRRKGDD